MRRNSVGEFRAWGKVIPFFWRPGGHHPASQSGSCGQRKELYGRSTVMAFCVRAWQWACCRQGSLVPMGMAKSREQRLGNSIQPSDATWSSLRNISSSPWQLATEVQKGNHKPNLPTSYRNQKILKEKMWYLYSMEYYSTIKRIK